MVGQYDMHLLQPSHLANSWAHLRGRMTYFRTPLSSVGSSGMASASHARRHSRQSSHSGTTPVDYNYTDGAVTPGTTYYYKLQFSGEGCGGATVMHPQMVEAAPFIYIYLPLIVR